MRQGRRPYIIGIDPGSYKCGYGVIDDDGAYVASGTVVMPRNRPLYLRLRELYNSLSEIIAEFRPTIAVVEKMFYAVNVQAAISLGQARGVVLLAVSVGQMDLHEYSPNEVKKSVVGYGKADKNQVQMMVASILNLKGTISPDGADALAIALCHRNIKQFEDKVNAQ